MNSAASSTTTSRSRLQAVVRKTQRQAADDIRNQGDEQLDRRRGWPPTRSIGGGVTNLRRSRASASNLLVGCSPIRWRGHDQPTTHQFVAQETLVDQWIHHASRLLHGKPVRLWLSWPGEFSPKTQLRGTGSIQHRTANGVASPTDRNSPVADGSWDRSGPVYGGVSVSTRHRRDIWTRIGREPKRDHCAHATRRPRTVAR